MHLMTTVLTLSKLCPLQVYRHSPYFIHSTSVQSLWNMHLSDNSSEINQNLSASARDISQDKSISYSLETLISFLKFNVFLLTCGILLQHAHRVHQNVPEAILIADLTVVSTFFLIVIYPRQSVGQSLWNVILLWSKFMERYFIVCIFCI